MTSATYCSGCAAKLFWNRVCAEKRRHKFNRRRLVQLPDDTQNLQLFVKRQAVTGLGLHRGRPATQKPVCARLREREKLGFTRGACFAHGRANSATSWRRSLRKSRPARASRIHRPGSRRKRDEHAHPQNPAGRSDLSRRRSSTSLGNSRSISSEGPAAAITPSRTIIPPSSMMASSLSSGPTRARCGPARVTS